MSEEIVNPNSLTVAQGAYLESLSEFTLRESPLVNLKHLLLLEKDSLVAEYKIQTQRVAELKISKGRSSKKVRESWKILEEFVEEKATDLDKYDLVPLVYGSVIFDDPNNLDFDLVLTSKNKIDKGLDLTDTWTRDLTKRWNGSEGHVSDISTDNLKKLCEHFQVNDKDYIRKFAEDIFFQFETASTIMTGELVTPKGQEEHVQVEKLKKIREVVWQQALETPEFLATMISCLQSTVVTREIRRSGLDRHQLKQ